MMRSHSKHALLQLLHTPKIGPKTLAKIVHEANQCGATLSDFADWTTAELVAMGVPTKSIPALQQANDWTRFLDELDTKHIQLVCRGETDYPSAFMSRSWADVPALLFLCGQRRLLDVPGLALAGSRHVSPWGLKVTQECVRSCADASINIVSGYANGVDIAAHAAALEAGLGTTMVLAEGMFRLTIKPEIASYLDREQHLWMSSFPPQLPWSVGNAMQRNSAIIGLAEALLVIEAGSDGGTFAAGVTALEQKRPLFVVCGPGLPSSASGNAKLIERGAFPLNVTSSGNPDLALLLQHLRPITPSILVSRPAQQLSLFDN